MKTERGLNMKFNEKLYTLRKAANMTQTELAERLNVSRQAISRWEMGTTKPEVDTIILNSNIFHVTLDELLKNQEETPQIDIPEPPVSGPCFWDFVPKKWWIAALLAILCRLLPYGIMFMGILSRPSSEATTATPGVLFSMVAWIPILTTLSAVFVIVLILCFIWALVKWLNARNNSN